jgi:hypothetical protein
MDVTGLKGSSTPERIGRYVLLTGTQTGIWFGLHWPLWRDSGATPLWFEVSSTRWGGAKEIRAFTQTWTQHQRHPFVLRDAGGFAVGLHVPPNAEFTAVTEAVLAQLAGFTAAVTSWRAGGERRR